MNRESVNKSDAVLYDSIDKDYVSLGGVRGDTDNDFDIEVLVTFEGDINSTDLELTRVDLVKAPNEIHFGFIEPDYGYEE